MPNRVTRWIRSGVELCMVCLLPPDIDNLPLKARKRKKRRLWMIRRKEKVKVDPGSKEAKTSPQKDDKKIADSVKKKDDNSKKKRNATDKGNTLVIKARPLPPAPDKQRSFSADKTEKMDITKKSEKPRKVKISPNCKGCLNKEHNPRKIKARLSSKLQREEPNVNNEEVESKSTSSKVVLDRKVARSSIPTKPRKEVSRGDKALPQRDKILKTNETRCGKEQSTKKTSVKDSKCETTGHHKLPEKLRKCKAAWASSPNEDLTTDDGNTDVEATKSSRAHDTAVDTAESSSGESLRSVQHETDAARSVNVECRYYHMVTSVAAKHIGLEDDDTEEELHSIKEGSESNNDDETDGSEIQTGNIDADPSDDSNDDDDIVCEKPGIAMTTPRITRVDDDQDGDSHDDDDDIIYGGPVFAMATLRNDADVSDEKNEDSYGDDDDDDDGVIGKPDITMATPRNDGDVADDQDEFSHDDDDDIVYGGPVFTIATLRNDHDVSDEKNEDNYDDDDDIVIAKPDITMATPRNEDVDDQFEDSHDDDDDIVFGGPVFTMATPRNDDVASDDQSEDSDDDDNIVTGKSDITMATPRNDDVHYGEDKDIHDDDDDDIVTAKSDIAMVTPRNDDVDDQDEDSNDDDDDITMATSKNTSLDDGQEYDGEIVRCNSSAIVKDNKINAMRTGSTPERGGIASTIQSIATALGQAKSTTNSCVDKRRVISEMVSTSGLSTFERPGVLSLYEQMAAAKAGMLGQVGMGIEYIEDRTSADEQLSSNHGPSDATSGLSMFERPKALSLYEMMTAAKTGILGHVEKGTGSTKDRISTDGQQISNQEHPEVTGGLSMFKRPKALSLYEMMAIAKTGMLGYVEMDNEFAEDMTSVEKKQISNQEYSEQGKATSQSIERGTAQKEIERSSTEANTNQPCAKSCTRENKPSLPGSGDRVSEDPTDQKKTDGPPGSCDISGSRQSICPKSPLIDRSLEKLKVVSSKPPQSPLRRKSKTKSDVQKTDRRKYKSKSDVQKTDGRKSKTKSDVKKTDVKDTSKEPVVVKVK